MTGCQAEWQESWGEGRCQDSGLEMCPQVTAKSTDLLSLANGVGKAWLGGQRANLSFSQLELPVGRWVSIRLGYEGNASYEHSGKGCRHMISLMEGWFLQKTAKSVEGRQLLH